MHTYDVVDLDLLRALAADPRASYVALAERLGLSRNTVQARMTQLEAEGAFLPFDRRIDTHGLGYPLTAFITVVVRQRELQRIAEDIAKIPEVVQAHGLSGHADLLAIVVCRDTDDLFRVDALLLAIEGVVRTETALSMGELIPHRLQPLVAKVKGEKVTAAKTRPAS
ncbi:MAG TPA: Lrp/AsnC family transcriptional regulator [Pseudolysinimonas sp.]|nr:Lrp/AsnC family transcriptional regulator [Pseudolysinimonas sp.]